MLGDTHALRKLVWTEADFDKIGWVDTVVRALAFFPDEYEFALDIDHTIKWVPPTGDALYYERWTAPATLVFRNVAELKIEGDFAFHVAIDELKRRDPGVPRNADFVEEKTDWLWVLKFATGGISFRSTGFHEYFRRQPVMKDRLLLHERGGISFDRNNADAITE